MDEVVLKSLAECNCAHQSQLFKDNEIDQEIYLDLTLDDLRLILPGKVGPQKRIWSQLVLERARQNLNAISTVGEDVSSVISDDSHNQKCSWALNLEDLTILKQIKLGSGQFGSVFVGMLKQFGKLEKVAVKMIELESSADTKCLELEVNVMMSLGTTHDNILKLIGAGSLDPPNRGNFILVTEFCNTGDLQHYLRLHKNDFSQDWTDDDSRSSLFRKFEGMFKPKFDWRSRQVREIIHPYTLRSSQLLEWALQIACGMKFLGVKKIVHADLATRNILLYDNTVKIGDFGLSRILHEKVYYRKKTKTPLPWQWMSLESLKELKFSVWSDIWSYGVTLWEMFSLAETPYPGYQYNEEFVKTLGKGVRLKKPKYSTTFMYEIMKQCWDESPSNRITFESIAHRLSGMNTVVQGTLNAQQNYHDMNQNSTCLESPASLLLDFPFDEPSSHILERPSDEPETISFDIHETVKKYVVSRNQICIDYTEVLSRSTYGIIWKGTLTKGSIITPVAVKSAWRRVHFHARYIAYLLSELKILAYIGSHENLQSFVAVNTENIRNHEIYILLAECKISLKKFLEKEAERYTRLENGETVKACVTYVNIEETEETDLLVNHLVRWSAQIANGMVYLGDKNILHGKLAAKNIYLDMRNNAKICNFTFARRLVTDDFILQEPCMIPWRWLALETLTSLKFSKMTDVWGYGITIWEMFSLGQVPYGTEPWTPYFQEQLRAGLRLKCPLYSTEAIYVTMAKCWQVEPSTRPTFEVLRDFFKSLKTDPEQPSGYLEPKNITVPAPENDENLATEPASKIISTSGSTFSATAPHRYIPQKDMIRYQTKWRRNSE